jgi:oleate hydratase
MPGENITLLEKHSDVGGAMDGVRGKSGYLCRGERELEAYMECLWYLCSKVPSLENPGRTVLDDVVDFNKDEPIHSESRALVRQGHIVSNIHDMKLPPKIQEDMQRLLATPEKTGGCHDQRLLWQECRRLFRKQFLAVFPHDARLQATS